MTNHPRPLSDLGAAVVGTGFAGSLHIDALRRLGVQVTGVVGSSADRAAEHAAALGVSAYPSLRAMLADPAVDVVHVASPNAAHRRQVLGTLAAGKHVVCAAPLGLTPRQTGELLQRAGESGLVHATAFNHRFHPMMAHMAARVYERELGEVRLVHGSWQEERLSSSSDWDWRCDPRIGGPLGVVAALGLPWVDLVESITRRHVVQVMAELRTFVPVRHQPLPPPATEIARWHGEWTYPIERAVELADAGGILLRLQDGGLAVLTVSQVSPGHGDAMTLEVVGSARSFRWDGERPEQLVLGRRGKPHGLIGREPRALAPIARIIPQLPPGYAGGYADTVRGLLDRVYADVARGGPSAVPLYPTFAAGHRAAVVGAAILRSARSGRWASVG